jgi:VanZ family protein
MLSNTTQVPRLVYFLPAILWASLIFYLSHQSSTSLASVPLWDFILHKLAHLFVYFVLAVLLLFGFSRTNQRLSMPLTLILCSIYAISDEVHQSFIPTRTPALSDVFIDIFGSTLAVLCFPLLQKTFTKVIKRLQ